MHNAIDTLFRNLVYISQHLNSLSLSLWLGLFVFSISPFWRVESSFSNLSIYYTYYYAQTDGQTDERIYQVSTCRREMISPSQIMKWTWTAMGQLQTPAGGRRAPPLAGPPLRFGWSEYCPVHMHLCYSTVDTIVKNRLCSPISILTCAWI